MKRFYNREYDVEKLRRYSQGLSTSYGRLTTVVGRRRVGKTEMLKHAFTGLPFLYLFVNKKKSEKALAEEWAAIIAQTLNVPMFGQPERLIDIVVMLLKYCEQVPLTVVIDEFQDIMKVRPDFFADLQNHWDDSKRRSKIHLVCCGSVYTMMKKLFEDDKESLFGRANWSIDLQPLEPSYLRQILHDEGRYSPEAMLLYYTFSGGIPRYIELLNDVPWEPDNIHAVWDELIVRSSLVVDEGNNRLAEDVGGDKDEYFQILDALASGYTTRPKIEDRTKLRAERPLLSLEKTLSVIARLVPITDKGKGGMIRYNLVDPFLRFWFRYINRNSTAVEIGNFDFIRDQIEQDYTTYSGLLLEQLFREILAESKQFKRIGSYWDKSETQNEIDIVAFHASEKKILIVECKRQRAKYKPELLRAKADVMLKKIPKYGQYEVELACFSLDDFDAICDRFLGPVDA